MESSIFKQAAKFLREQKTYKRWLSVFFVLALVVALGTVTALKYTGQAASYEQKVLSCGLEVHKHTQSCYDKEGKLICGKADYVVHVHNDDCYDAAGNLVCKLPEVKEHKHDASCYKTQSVLICTQEETAGHVHSDACYEKQKASLLCTLAEHSHGDSCYDEEGVLTCTQEEHQHTDDCYSWDNVLTCGMEEGAGAHTHTDACYQTEKVLACGKLENHTHDKKTCYDKDGNLICDKTVLEEHVHSADCFETVKLSPEEVAARNSAAATEAPEESAEPETTPEPEVFFTEPDSSVEEGGLLTTGSDLTVMGSGKVKMGVDMETKTFEGADFTVSVSYTAEANIPEEAELSVVEILPGDEGYEDYMAQTLEALEATEESLAAYRLFDISFMLDGEEIEPEDTVDVTISYADGSEMNMVSTPKVVHFAKEAEKPEVIDVDVVGDKYCYSQDSFSVVAAPYAERATTYTVKFDGNSNYAKKRSNSNRLTSGTVRGSVNDQTVSAGDEITLPECGFTNSSLNFVGWSTRASANDASDSATDAKTYTYANHQATIYKPGDKVKITEDTTFYAIWGEKNANATFFVSLGNSIPTEPRNSDANTIWTSGITIQDALDEERFEANQEGIHKRLNKKPTDQQLVNVVNAKLQNGIKVDNRTVGYYEFADGTRMYSIGIDSKDNLIHAYDNNNKDLGTVSIKWYVIKHAITGAGSTEGKNTEWHVDGILLLNKLVQVYYDAGTNVSVQNLPDGYSCVANTSAKAGASNGPTGTVKDPTRNDGYIFTGWKMYTLNENGEREGDGIDYQPGASVTIKKNTVFVAQWKNDQTNLTVKKTDEKGNVLEGATFTLGDSEKTTEKTTEKDGLAEFGKIELNTKYTLTETAAPEGYNKKLDAISFQVTKAANGEVSVTFYKDNRETNAPEGVTVDTKGDVVLTVVNTQVKAKVQVFKIADNSSLNGPTMLSGAEFTFGKADEDPKVLSATEADGKIKITDNDELPYGRYILTETKAPDGYYLLEKPITIEVKQNGSVGVTVDGQEKTGWVTENDGTYTINVPNSSGYALPETGGAGTTIYTFGGIAILAFGLMYGYSLRRKRERRSA